MKARYSEGDNRPDFAVPQGACDCHMHFFHQSYSLAKTASVIHSEALPIDYRLLQSRLGLNRHVIVQPSSYGTDNKLLLDMLAECGPTAKGIAVIGTQVSDLELETLDHAGVVGVRFNLVQAGATAFEMLLPIAKRIQPLGWHIQLHTKPVDLMSHREIIDQLPVSVVLDHIARANTDPSIASELQTQVLRWLKSGRLWMKLSGAYLASTSAIGSFDDLDSFVMKAVDQSPTQLVWGSDWPHATETEKPNDAELMNLLSRWIPNTAVLHQVLVSTPAKLYRFDG